MSKKVPQVSDLIDNAIIQVADMMKAKDITPHTLSICLGMLLDVDKNNRLINSTFTKNTDKWTDERLEEELKKAGLVDASKDPIE